MPELLSTSSPISSQQKVDNSWSLDRWMGVAGAVLGLVGLVLSIVFFVCSVAWPDPTKQWILNLMSTNWSSMLVKFVAICIVALLLWVLWRTRVLTETRQQLLKSQAEVTRLNQRLTNMTENLNHAIAGREPVFPREFEPEKLLSDFVACKRIPDRRWETIKKVKYGHLEYAPFLKHADNGLPEGMAVRLLTELLDPDHSKSIEIKCEGAKRTWPTVIDGLVEGKCEVVATPLFETFERSKKVRFTAPMFFSNIGLYVSKLTWERTVWQGINPARIAEDLKTASDVKLLAVPGEISQYLAQKYADRSQIEEQLNDTVFSALFDRIATSNRPPYAIFCESFRAHLEPTVKDRLVINVLEPAHQILYPVCFAVRKGDYQLANLLNLRLLQLTQKQAMLEYLAKSLASSLGDDLKMEESLTKEERDKRIEARKQRIQEHFVFQWNGSTAVRESANA